MRNRIVEKWWFGRFVDMNTNWRDHLEHAVQSRTNIPFHSLKHAFLCVHVSMCTSIYVCVYVWVRVLTRPGGTYGDAFCVAIYMMTNYVEKYRCNRNKSCDIDIFSYNLGNLLKGVACIKMKIQFVLGHFEHVDNLGCPI